MSEEPKKEQLWNVFYELNAAQQMLEYLMDPGDLETVVHYPTLQNLHILLGITVRKINYYQQRYDFRVDFNDVFYPEDITEFLVFHTKGNGTQEENEKEESHES